MNRKPIAPLTLILAVALGVAACSSTPDPASTALSGNTTTSAPTLGAELARTDAQGAVEFVVTPLNFSASGTTIDFRVSMDTHATDLSWDLAAQSTLKNDAGLEVKGQTWPVGNGHHYEATLSFPAKTAEGQSLLDGAKTLTLTIRNTNVAERKFVWELSK